MKQIEKNTVDARRQLKEDRFIRFIHPEGTGRRILFAGNSITLHGIKPEIGWHWEWGMAASCKENDYVHRCMAAIREKEPDPAFCIAQVSRWEVNFTDYEAPLKLHQAARDFGADTVIIRALENCPWTQFREEIFTESYNALIDFLNPNNGQVILTTGFWHSDADDTIRKIGAQRGYPVVYLGDLGDRDDMKAIGQFEHQGVCQHPNDAGMAAIAERILEVL